jgi:hypothetical protein
VEEYKKMIKTIFQESNETYGVDRICGELRKRGKTASYHRVKGFMDDMGLHSIHKRRRQKSLTDSRKARGDEYVNLVKDLEITEPFQTSPILMNAKAKKNEPYEKQQLKSISIKSFPELQTENKVSLI